MYVSRSPLVLRYKMMKVVFGVVVLALASFVQFDDGSPLDPARSVRGEDPRNVFKIEKFAS